MKKAKIQVLNLSSFIHQQLLEHPKLERRDQTKEMEFFYQFSSQVRT